MRQTLAISFFVCLWMIAVIHMDAEAVEKEDSPKIGRIFYVRQTVGNDANDGLTPKTAWQHISKLSSALRSGDTAYVGPGLYRERVLLHHSGTVDQRITLIADRTGQHTGDPPGVVMLTGAEPVDESIFQPHPSPGMHSARFDEYPVLGVVEMDGEQYRYQRARDTREHLVEKMAELEVVAKLRSCFFYDGDAKILYIHTSDGKPPGKHEIELIRRGNGFYSLGKQYVTIIGFVIRHTGHAGIHFLRGAAHGTVIDNISYGTHQGIRASDATDMAVYQNTLFRNNNSGIYFAAHCINCLALGNTAYENVKGVRWASQSVGGIAYDNTLFDNIEAGISVEKSDRTILRKNRLKNNRMSQLKIFSSEYDSEENCFEHGTEQPVVEFLGGTTYNSLGEYQRAEQQDLHSREKDCGPLPEKLDVIRLHRETMGYTESAREILRKSQDPESSQ